MNRNTRVFLYGVVLIWISMSLVSAGYDLAAGLGLGLFGLAISGNAAITADEGS